MFHFGPAVGCGNCPMNLLHDITAVILAGGTGTRLRSVVADRPKVLAPVGGKPFLAHLLDQLLEQGVQKVVLCTGYQGEQVQDYFGDSYQGISLNYSREDRALGTGGALLQARPLLDSDSVLVLNGDSYCRTDLQASLASHRQRCARATIVLARVGDGRRYGRVEFAADGRIERFCEKDGAPGAGWINSGIYWFERTALSNLPRREPLSLERDVLEGWVGEGLYAYPQSGPFLDIGIPEDYARAVKFMAEIHEPISAMSA